LPYGFYNRYSTDILILRNIPINTYSTHVPRRKNKFVCRCIKVEFFPFREIQWVGNVVPFQLDQFESMDDCTCVNHEFIFSGSGQKSFRMYILHTLISSLKILPVLSQKYVMSPFRDFRVSQNPALALFHYY